MRVVEKRVSVAVVAVALSTALGSLAASASAAERLSVKNESANFRDGPGDKHAIVYSADKFYPVEALEKKDGWVKVKDFEGDVAWVAERLLAKQETIVVEGDKVNVREKPNTTSEIAFKAERGEVFKVESHQGKWLKVTDASGDGGWIRDDMVWGERDGASATPKGKTKGELEEPSAKPGVAPISDKGADKAEKAAAKPKADKSSDKTAAKPKADKTNKAEGKPKDGKPDAKPNAEDTDKAKGAAAKPADETEPADPKKQDGKGDDDAKADDAKADDAKADDTKADDTKAGDAKADDTASEKTADKADADEADTDKSDKNDDAG